MSDDSKIQGIISTKRFTCVCIYIEWQCVTGLGVRSDRDDLLIGVRGLDERLASAMPGAGNDNECDIGSSPERCYH